MRKAVSPVIATLLLILIAVAAAVLVYVWVTGYASSVTGTGTPELQERIKIEAVSYDSDTKVLTVYIRNIGDTKVTIDAIYVTHAASGSSVTVATGLGDEASPGDVVEEDLTNVNLNPGETYIIKAVTENGVEAAISFSYSE